MTNELSEKLQNAIHRLVTGEGTLRTMQYDVCLVALHGKEEALETACTLLNYYGLTEKVEGCNEPW